MTRGDLEILVHDEGNLFVRSHNVAIQVRTGLMTASVLDRIESAARLFRATIPGPVGALSIVEEGAELAGPEVRVRQANLLRSLLSDRRTYLAAVVLGESIGTRAILTVMRVLLLGTPRLHVARTPAEAASWLAEQLGNVSSAELSAMIVEARRLARAAP